jgi:hypothetical protein
VAYLGHVGNLTSKALPLGWKWAVASAGEQAKHSFLKQTSTQQYAGKLQCQTVTQLQHPITLLPRQEKY